MSLNTRTEELENRRLSLTVEVDQERVDQELRKAARKLSREYRIPGFRRGKAPYPVVARFVGLPTLYNEFVDSLAEEIYKKAIEQEKIEPYAMAALDVTSLEPLTYSYEIPLEPTVDLGDYRSLRIKEEEPEVTDEEIEERLQSYREQYADWTEVERPSQWGDMLTLDVKSVLIADKEAEEGEGDDEEVIVLDETDWDVTLDEENPLEPPGLDEELIGLSPGEEKEFILGWPEDSQSIYAGKQARFKITVKSIQANLEPKLDDDFAQMIGPDFNTMDDLRTSIRESILNEKKTQAENEYLEKALDALVEQSKMDYPPVVVEDQIDAMVEEFERQLRAYGIESLEAYLDQVGQTMEEYRDALREQAEIAARRNLVISELYRQEGITVSDEEIEERIQNIIEGFGDANPEVIQPIIDNMRSGPGRTVLESQILQEKTLERLKAIARGEELPEPSAPEEDDGPGEAEASDEPSEEESDVIAATASDNTESAEAINDTPDEAGNTDDGEDASSQDDSENQSAKAN